jgi:hypothetical protein
MRPRSLLFSASLVVLLASCNSITGINDLTVESSGSGSGSGNGSGAGSGAGGAGSGSGAGGTTGTMPGPALGPAGGVTVDQIAIYQGPKRLLMGGKQTGTVTVPVVAGRDALVRVFTHTDGTYDGGPVTAHLILGQGAMPIEVVGPAPGSSSETSLTSTINFNVPGAAITPGVTYRVELLEPNSTSTNSAASYPAGGGFDPLGSVSDGAQLKVVLLPVQYGGDGSNRLPDTSAAQLQQYKNAFMGTYPIDTIDLTVHAPFPWANQVLADGTGWSELLQGVADYRQQQGTPPDTYFFAPFAPASSFPGFCGGGCVAGLGLIGSASDAYSRAAIGLGFTDPSSYTTIIHEIGHTQGRQHSPCGGASNPDPAYPYPGADIGDVGYNIVTKALLMPGTHFDMMGYCDPVFISDYVFNAIFNEIKTVNHAEIIYPPGLLDRTWERAVLDMHGNLSWIAPIHLPTPPGGQATPVTVQTANGTAAVDGRFITYDHLPGGILFWPEGSSPATGVQASLGGQLKSL